jgi:hypothetical protein
MAASVRITHLPLDWTMFLWQMVSLFLFLLACWRLSAKCTPDARARWAGVALLAVLLTLPVAGTALYIMDQYMNPRNLVAFAAVFAVVRVLERRYLQAALFLIFVAVIHPLMSVFAIFYCLLLMAPWKLSGPQNRWAQSFLWIRENTPVDARFALDPSHKNIHGEDTDGFRALAERSMLADAAEDSGAVTMFPPLGEEWSRQGAALSGWKGFQAQDFRRLHAEYGANWVVLQQPGVAGLECPYQNQVVRVCRL